MTDKLLYFSALWCQPCKTYKPIIKQLKDDFGIQLSEIDADTQRELVNEYGITTVPTVVKVDVDGNEITRLVGAYPYNTVIEKLELQ